MERQLIMEFPPIQRPLMLIRYRSTWNGLQEYVKAVGQKDIMA